MSKFLEQVEENMPTDELDNIIAGKRALQKFLFGKDVKVEVKTFRDEITFTLDDGSKVVVEVKDYKSVDGVEDGEINPKKMEALSTLLNVNTPKVAIPGTVSAEVKKTQKKALRDLQTNLSK